MERKGFTLIELMIVVSIIGILSALAIPNFLNFRGKAVQAEAKSNLGGIFVCQEIYFSDYNTYAGGSDAFEIIDFIPIAGAKRYSYILDQSVLLGTVSVNPLPSGIPSSAESFTAIAVTNLDDDPFIDFWVINEKRSLRNSKIDESGNIIGDGSDLRRK